MSCLVAVEIGPVFYVLSGFNPVSGMLHENTKHCNDNIDPMFLDFVLDVFLENLYVIWLFIF